MREKRSIPINMSDKNGQNLTIIHLKKNETSGASIMNLVEKKFSFPREQNRTLNKHINGTKLALKFEEILNIE